MSYEFTGIDLSTAVATICPDIEAQISVKPKVLHDERALWREMSCCILSSQVPYELAQAASAAVETSALLVTAGDLSVDEMAEALAKVLSAPVLVNGSLRTYRFHRVKARQLATVWDEIRRQGGSVGELLSGFQDAVEARRWLTINALGLGPKQSSMFLRNIGLSYDLAVLDRHVLAYMEKLDLFRGTVRISQLRGYLELEEILRKHAREVGYPVGLMDWAIWIVMRVARQQKMELH